MKHLFGNLFASIDVETTGLVAGTHEIIQIAIAPLDDNLDARSDLVFYTNIRPERPELTDPQSTAISGLDFAALENAPSQDRVADLLEEWFTTLPLPIRGKLIPIAHNWTFEYSFLRAWLGLKGLEHYFHIHPRDTMICALAMKDQAALRGKPLPFESVSLTNLCRVYGIKNDRPHDALADALAEVELYKKLLGAP